ncbi:MAG: 2-phosphosulfolactate phosphatase [Deltaproteobacteria bacterium]|nr:2-phosphosulfolactate phosphatase [Deltaproteobacteria bacterium]MBI3390464.1 2-phosphosulfolactate phosphatase [Deltaproteobacteria bacterium]
MEIRIDSLLRGAQEAEGTVVIVDVLRAFTTAAVAFARGAARIVLVASVDEALDLRSRGVGELCMGEVHGKRPAGFDFGNSPFELSIADVRGRTLIHSTTAGTVGVTAAHKATQIFVAALVNAQATVQALRRDDPAVVTIVAMGAQGETRADEDELCALYLRNLLQGRQPDRDAVRRLVLASAESQNYDDPSRPQFHPKDREIALQIDSIPLAIRVAREGGLLIARAAALA